MKNYTFILFLLPGLVFSKEAPEQQSLLAVYGRVDLAYESVDTGLQTHTQWQNMSSRVGLKGELPWRNEIKLIYQIETTIAPNNHLSDTQLASRNSYIGLASDRYGELLWGRHNMPLKSLEAYNAELWGSADVQEVLLHGKGSERRNTRVNGERSRIEDVHTRQYPVWQYETPRLHGMRLRVAYGPGQSDDSDWGRVPVYGASIDYRGADWRAGVAHEVQKHATAPGKHMEATKAVLGYQFDKSTVGLGLANLDNHEGRSFNVWTLTATHQINKDWEIKANMGGAGNSVAGAGDWLRMWGAEANYRLKKDAFVYAYYARIDNGPNARGNFEAAQETFRTDDGLSPKVLGVGFRYNF